MDTCYISCSCNRTPNSLDWGRNENVCFASNCSIAVCQYKERQPSKIFSTLVSHKERVNCVRWIHRKEDPENEFVSCSTDKTAVVWRKNEETKEFTPVARLEGHLLAVNVCSAVYVPNSKGEFGQIPRTFAATVSVDSTLKIWERKENNDSFKCIQTIQFGSGFALDVTFTLIPNTNIPLMVCGGDDQKISVYVEQESQFLKVDSLVGHEDWIRGLDVTIDDNNDILVASCSQDNLIRIWRMSVRDPDTIQSQSLSKLSIDEDIKISENTFTFKKDNKICCYAVLLETVLAGHENFVYSARWQPAIYTEGKRHQPMVLLSASMDKTMIRWKPDMESGVWTEEVRVGEVGGNTLGFYGGVFSPDGKSILAHGFQGAFHLWHASEDSNTWNPGVTVGGHFGSVQDIAWDPEGGEFLLSSSVDQTTRLHGNWIAGDETAWHELARPQVHGYDMQCIAMIDRYTFASGADEKVTRVFKAPRNFIENFSTLCKMDVTAALDNVSCPQGASVPALGLSNKAVFEGENQNLYGDGEIEPQKNDQYSEAYFSPLALSAPPTEENLLQNTLWPEIQKLYGHGFEIFAIAAHPSGKILATSCKAAKPEHAGIILWNTQTWKQICTLHAHTLTITQLKFSHDGEYLLSVSRDRMWSLHKHRSADKPETDPLYEKVAFSDKKTAVHARIIWACSWSHDDKFFITVSRDKKAVIWGPRDGAGDSQDCLGMYGAVSSPLLLPDSVTAVDFAPVLLSDKCYLVSFGLDNGTVHLYKWNTTCDQEAWKHLKSLNNSEAHHGTVKKLQFRPVVGEVGNTTDSQNKLQLASCATDNSVKIYSIDVNNL